MRFQFFFLKTQTDNNQKKLRCRCWKHLNNINHYVWTCVLQSFASGIHKMSPRTDNFVGHWVWKIKFCCHITPQCLPTVMVVIIFVMMSLTLALNIKALLAVTRSFVYLLLYLQHSLCLSPDDLCLSAPCFLISCVFIYMYTEWLQYHFFFNNNLHSYLKA